MSILNGSEVKQRSERSQIFHLNSDEGKERSCIVKDCHSNSNDGYYAINDEHCKNVSREKREKKFHSFLVAKLLVIKQDNLLNIKIDM